MIYRYDERLASDEKDGIERVADLYVIQGLDVLRPVSASGELLRAAAYVSPDTRRLLNRILQSGFLAAIRT